MLDWAPEGTPRWSRAAPEVIGLDLTRDAAEAEFSVRLPPGLRWQLGDVAVSRRTIPSMW